MRCEECLTLIDGYVEGELDAHAAARLASHLTDCAGCAGVHQSLRREQEIYSRYLLDVEAPPALWVNLRASIEKEKALREVSPLSRLGGWLAALFRAPRRAPALARALVMICAAGIIFAATQYVSPRRELTGVETIHHPVDGSGSLTLPLPTPPAPETPTAPERAGREIQLAETGMPVSSRQGDERNGAKRTPRAARTQRAESVGEWLRGLTTERGSAGEEATILTASSARTTPGQLPTADSLDFEAAIHAEKAQHLLRSFRNSRNPERGSGVDVSYEKRQSKELLVRNILLRRGAQAEGNLPTEELLSRLEPILIDIANLPEKVSRDDVRQIKEQMRKKEIVSALHFHSMQTSAVTF